MKERPLLLTGPDVRAILDGRKTQTRRVVEPQPPGLGLLDGPGGEDVWVHLFDLGRFFSSAGPGLDFPYRKLYPRFYSPFGRPGDVLWVRETWADVNTEEGPAIAYRADRHVQTWHSFCVEPGPDEGAGPSMNYEKYPGEYCMWYSDLFNGEPDHGWRPSTHMPKWACRLRLRVTGVRVERLQNISRVDAIADGDGDTIDPRIGFARLWDSTHKPGKRWADNPWVFVIDFERVAP